MEKTEKKVAFSNEIPKIYHRLKEVFNVDWDKGIIICYGDTIHCKFDLPPEKIAHELVHVKQQEKIGKDLWWDSYFVSPTFRLEQEVEAFKKEYDFICSVIKDRNKRFDYLYELSRILSGEQYGNICSFSEAMSLIQK